MAADFPEPEMIDTGEIRLASYSAGSGPAVILLHGFPELAFSWRHQLPALAEAGSLRETAIATSEAAADQLIEEEYTCDATGAIDDSLIMGRKNKGDLFFLAAARLSAGTLGFKGSFSGPAMAKPEVRNSAAVSMPSTFIENFM